MSTVQINPCRQDPSRSATVNQSWESVLIFLTGPPLLGTGVGGSVGGAKSMSGRFVEEDNLCPRREQKYIPQLSNS
jgi:hypothetical protein